MIGSRRFAALLVSLVIMLGLGCAHAPQDSAAWGAASDAAAHNFIKTDSILKHRLGEVNSIAPAKVSWDKVKSPGMAFWKTPARSRLATYRIKSAGGNFNIQIITQEHDGQAQVTYWAWAQ